MLTTKVGAIVVAPLFFSTPLNSAFLSGQTYYSSKRRWKHFCP